MTGKVMRIGLSGPARCGKDYAAQHLIELYGGEILRFSDPLYELMYLMQEFVGFDRIKDRRLLQWVGTDWARARDKQVWLRLFQQRLDKMGEDTNVFVTDLRFPGEADLLKSQGFTLIRIERANLPNADAPWRQHESERALDGYQGWDIVMEKCPEGPDFLYQMREVVASKFDIPMRRVVKVEQSDYLITPP